jgi:hypothetical protein
MLARMLMRKISAGGTITAYLCSRMNPCPIPSKMEDFMGNNPPTHLRMPQRAEAVEGKEPQPGIPTPIAPVSDPRTASQDPVLKVKLTLPEGSSV